MPDTSLKAVVLFDHTVFAAVARETERSRGVVQPPFPPGDSTTPASSCLVTLRHQELWDVGYEALSTNQLLDLGLRLHTQGGSHEAHTAAERLRKVLEQGFEGCLEDVEPQPEDYGGLLAAPAAAAARILDAVILVTTKEELLGRESALGLEAILTPGAWLLLANQLTNGRLG